MTDPESLYNTLLNNIRDAGTETGMNLIAFSGGVDSSLVAKAVYAVFPENSEAVLGVSPSLSREQESLAESISSVIGIPLRRVLTDEQKEAGYIENSGMSCYFCKQSLYKTMEQLLREIGGDHNDEVLYNGTNADDLEDPTRVGLKAAREHNVASPLAAFTKQQVREMSRYAGLPNWDIAAAPCTRSRLQIGVPATPENLRRIEQAEALVRERFSVSVQCNLRVRHLEHDLAMIEIDHERLDSVDLDRCRDDLLALGYADVEKRAFQSGSVSIDLSSAAPLEPWQPEARQPEATQS